MHDGSGPTTLLVASTGGHLEQLLRLSERLTPGSGSVTWVTHDDAQSRSLLAGRRVHLVPYVPPRGYRRAMTNLPIARAILRRGRFDRVVSTGAGIALPFLSAARMAGIPCHYIESAARADGPSLTGRLLSGVPSVHLYSQYPSWAQGRWHYRGSLFDGFTAERQETAVASRVVVTLGTMRTYEFTRAVDRLREVLPQVLAPGAEVLWQLGATNAEGLPGRAVQSIPQSELKAAVADADLVVAHAGIGSAITALELGRCPVLLPRRPEYGEHIDGHQAMIARELAGRGLAVTAEATDLTADQLRRAMATRVLPATSVSPFALDQEPRRRLPRRPAASGVQRVS